MVKSDLDPSKKKATILEFDKVLGLDIDLWSPQREEVPDAVKKLVEERLKARTEKNWVEADKLREQITALGYNIKDEGDLTTVSPK